MHFDSDSTAQHNKLEIKKKIFEIYTDGRVRLGPLKSKVYVRFQFVRLQLCGAFFCSRWWETAVRTWQQPAVESAM